jgi:hypothetical protein
MIECCRTGLGLCEILFGSGRGLDLFFLMRRFWSCELALASFGRSMVLDRKGGVYAKSHTAQIDDMIDLAITAFLHASRTHIISTKIRTYSKVMCLNLDGNI